MRQEQKKLEDSMNRQRQSLITELKEVKLKVSSDVDKLMTKVQAQ